MLAMLQMTAMGSGGSGRPPAATNTGVNDLAELLNSIGEFALLIDDESRRIAWVTDGCTSLHSSLEPGRASSVAAELLDAADWGAALQSQGVWHRAGEWSVESEAGVKRNFRITALKPHGRANSIWLRLVESINRQDYFKQYLADLDQLFNTSRSVSVGEMATTLAHELNQPIGTLLNIVRGVQQRLKQRGQYDDELFNALQLAERQGRFAADILNRIRDFTQSRRPKIVNCNVSRLLEDTIALLDWIFDSEGIEIDLQISDQNLTINGDLTLLQQVLVNLLRNSVESMCDSDTGDKIICVRARLDDGTVAVDIVDRGHGLDGSSEDYLFSPFVSEKPNGMGVGLNICRSFIELHQGRFWLSANEFGGCTAHLRFPRQTPSTQEEIR